MLNAIHRSPHIASRAILFKGREKELITKEELEAAREIQRKQEDLARQLGTVADSEPRKIKMAAREKYAADPSSENLEKLKELDLRKEILQARFNELRSFVKGAMRDTRKEAGQILASVMGRAAKIVEDECTKLEEQEKKNAETYGVPFGPSPTARGLRNLVDLLHRDVAASKFSAADIKATLADLVTL